MSKLSRDTKEKIQDDFTKKKYMYTCDPQYTTTLVQNAATYAPSNSVEEMQKRLQAYFTCVQRNLSDSVPQTIGAFLVDRVINALEMGLMSLTVKESEHARLLSEPDHISKKREQLSAEFVILRNAQDILANPL